MAAARAIFLFRPSPSRLLFFACGFQSVPRPRAWDVRTGGRFASAGGMAICLLLIVSCRSLAYARSLLSRLRFGFSSRASFFPAYRVGSRWSSSGPVLVSPRVSRPVRFLRRACFPPLSHPSGSVGSSPLARRPRLADSGAVPCHPIGDGSLLRLVGVGFPSLAPASRPLCSVRLVPRSASPRRSPSRLSVCLLHLSRSRGGLAIVSALPRSAFRPALLIEWRGERRCFLSSRSARCLEAFLVVARSSMAGRLGSCPFLSSLLACPRLGSCVGGVSISCLRVACPQYAYRPVPHIVGAGRYFPFRLFFPVLAYSSIMA